MEVGVTCISIGTQLVVRHFFVMRFEDDLSLISLIIFGVVSSYIMIYIINIIVGFVFIV